MSQRREVPADDKRRVVRVLHSPWTGSTGNPYTRLWVAAALRSGVDIRPFSTRALVLRRPDILHVNWPEASLREPRTLRAAWRVGKAVARCAVARILGVRVVWTVHNLQSHEGRHPALEQLLWWCFCPLVDGAVLLTERSAPEVLKRFKIARASIYVIPHGHYLPVLAPAGEGRPSYDVGMVGALRTYKRHAVLLEAVKALPDPELRVLVAGSPSDAEYVRELRRKYPDDRITWELGKIDDVRFQQLVESCALVAAPQLALNSGSLIHALSCGRPVIAVRTSTFTEIAETVGHRWVPTYSEFISPDYLAECVRDARRLFAENKHPDLSALDWSVIGNSAADMYADVASYARRLRPNLGSPAELPRRSKAVDEQDRGDRR